MKKIFTIFFLILFAFPVLQAQQNDTIRAGMLSEGDDGPKRMPLNPSAYVMLGSSFGYLRNHGGVSSFSLAPGIHFPLSNKLSLNAGLIASTHYGQGLTLSENNGFGSFSFQTLSVYGSAAYMLNDRVIIFTSGTKRLTDLPFNSPYFYSNPNSFSIGSTFKISDHLFIGASFSTTDSYLPGSSFASPFNQTMSFPYFP